MVVPRHAGFRIDFLFPLMMHSNVNTHLRILKKNGFDIIEKLRSSAFLLETAEAVRRHNKFNLLQAGIRKNQY